MNNYWIPMLVYSTIGLILSIYLCYQEKRKLKKKENNCYLILSAMIVAFITSSIFVLLGGE